jgi:hypothetical protein
MKTTTAWTVMGLAALGMIGVLANKYLVLGADKCEPGTQRMESMGARYCLDDKATGYLQCVQPRVSKLAAGWKVGTSGNLELVVDDKRIALEGGNQKEMEAKTQNTDEAIKAGLAACKELLPPNGIKVTVIDSTNTSIRITEEH